MLKRIRERMNRDEGFTLIELMVVVLIIAILIAIAIPTFLGARERAQDRAAQSSVRNALTTAKTIFTDSEDYADATVTTLSESEPSLTFQAGSSNDPNTISFTSGTTGPTKDNYFVASAWSEGGTCFFIQDTAGPSSTTNTGTVFYSADDSDGTSCAAGTDAPAQSSGDWSDEW